jgi:septal ring factor EnvC (AmiA/AmiB activator)
MVLNLVAVVFLFTCGILFGTGQSTIGENDLFDFKQKMAAMEENIAKQEFRISSLEDQLKIQDIEIKDLKNKVLKFGPKIQEVEKSVASLRKIIMRIKPVEPENKVIPPEDDTKEKSFHIRTEGHSVGIQRGIYT